MLRRIVSILLVTVLALAVGIGVSQAAGGLSITSFGFIEGDCTYVSISITIVDFTYTDAAIDVQIFKNGSLVDSAQLSAYPSGSVSQGFVVDAVSGDSITATASIASAFATNAGPIVCGGSPGGATGGGAGSGATDGRLGYVPDEYYSLYCSGDQLHIWRGVPSGLELGNVSLITLLGMTAGDVRDIGGGMTVQRNSDDMFTVYGSNGNNAPNPGMKSFSMSECIARNGGQPAVSPQAPQVVDCSLPINASTRGCYPTLEAFCAAVSNSHPDCNPSSPPPPQSSVQVLYNCFYTLASTVCAGVTVPFGMVLASRRMRLKRMSKRDLK